MAEPITTGATVGSVAGWGLVASTLAGYVTSVDYSIVFGAFAGSIFFVVTTPDLSRLQIIGYFLFGYAAGVTGAAFAADLASGYLKYHDKPLDGLAAVIISSAAVHGYFWIKAGGLLNLPIVKKWLGGNNVK